jgi:DNA polymerase-3 subunit epsilon
MGAWHEGTLCAFDLESTGVSVEQDRIVTACVARIDGTGRTRPAAKRWLVDPDIEIPEGATAIHGISTQHAQDHGMDAATAICEIVDMLCRALDLGIPIVGYNISYDLTLLDRETRRHSLPPLSKLPIALMPVIDAMVLDKHVETYRRGSRKLVDVARHYNVALDGAHEASADAWAAAGVACRIGAKYPKVGTLSLDELHALQVVAKKDQDQSLADYWRRKAKSISDPDEKCAWLDRADSLTGHWPIVPFER